MTRKRYLQVYQAAVIAMGIASLFYFTAVFPVRQLFSALFFVALAVVAESQTVFMGNHKSVSLSSAVVIAAMLICGPAASLWVAAASVCGSVTRVSPKKTYTIFNTPVFVTLFNICNYVLSFAAMCVVYTALGGRPVGGGGTGYVLAQINRSAVALLTSIFAATAVNVVLILLYLAISGGFSAIRKMAREVLWPTASIFVVGLLGVLLTILYTSYGWFVLVLCFCPFLLARYVFIAYKEQQMNFLQTVGSLASAIEAKDAYTIGHSRRVEKYSLMIAKELRLSAKRCETLQYAALLHDIGKIGIPERILNKPGKLDEEEWAQIRSHPGKGAHIIEDIEFLSDAVEIIRSHHERYDGSGYPEGKDASKLSLESMILCAADAYDAMTSDRPYRRRMTSAQAMAELKAKSGIQFAPEVVAAFERAIKKAPAESGDDTRLLAEREAAATTEQSDGGRRAT